jgi:hypothetical protein
LFVIPDKACAAIAVCEFVHSPSVSRLKLAVSGGAIESTQLPLHTECSLVPNSFVAVTVKRYDTPFVRPAIVAALLSI